MSDSQWNLSVRLTGQGSGLSRTLRNTGRDARAASRDVNALRNDIASLRRAARNDIRVRVRLDSDDLRRDVQTAITGAGTGQGIPVSLTLANPMQLRRDVSDAVRWAGMNQTIRVRIEPDTSGLNGLTTSITNTTAGSAAASSGATASLKSLLLLAPAIIPLTTALAGLPAALGASAVSATAFGLAVGGQIAHLSEAAEAEKAYNDAVSEHGAGSLEAAQAQLAYQKQLAALPPEAQQAAAALTSLKSAYRQWSDSLSGDTMEPVVKSLTLMEALLPHLTPQAQAFSREMDRMVTLAGGAMATPGFDAMSDRFSDFTDRTLDSMGDKLVHVLRLLSEGDPGGGPLAAVMDYINANGEEAKETLANIGDAVGNLFEGAAQAGPTMLSLVNAAARLVGALPPELVSIVIQLAAALKLLQLAGAGAAAIAGGVAALGTRIAALQAASVAAGGGLAGLSAAFATLGRAAKASIVVAGIGAMVYAVSKLADIGKKAPPDVDKLTTSLGKLGNSGKVTGEAAKAFGKDFGQLRDQIDKVTDPSVVDSINNWGEDVSNGILAASDSKEEFQGSMDSIDKALTNLVQGGKADLAKAALENMLAGMSPEQAAKFKSEIKGYNSAIADLGFEADLTAQSMGIFGPAVQEVSAALGAQKGQVDGLRASLLALNETNRSAYDAQIQFESATDDLTEAFAKNGANLDISTRAGQANGAAMSAAAKAQDEMIVTGIAAGDSFTVMTQRASGLRAEMMRLATDAFKGNTEKAREFVNTLLGTPDKVESTIRLEMAEASRGLDEVQAKIRETPNAKRIEVSTLNAAAIAALEAVGLKTEQLPDGKTAVFTTNGQAIGSIDEVWRALDALDGKTATVYTVHHYQNITENRTINTGKGGRGPNAQADGSVLDFYADGGMRRPENHVAQMARAGTWRVWAEPETGGEAYIPLALSKRVRSRAIVEETVRRLGGDPMGIAWNANGNVTDWRYDPTTGSLYSPSDAGAAGRKTRKVKGKEVEYFDLGAVERRLKSASKATQAWNADLQKVADRVGGDVAEALASMGEEGVRLADKMAKGSTKYINEMAAALRGLQRVAKASLTDYTRQVGNATKLNKEFADDLARLAAMGYGDLAAQLAEQNDLAAQQIADAASKDKGKAAKANAAVKAANSALTAAEVQDLVAIIAAIKSAKTGIHDVAATTGLGEDQIITVANKAKGQINTSLGSRASRFMSDLVKANRHMAYADGGIRAGMYATQGGIIRFAEPSTGGEAYLPLGLNKRRQAMPVLANVATRFGVGLTDGQGARTVVIHKDAPMIGQQTNNITSASGNPRDVARQVGQEFGYQLRRAARGGVNSRASH